MSQTPVWRAVGIKSRAAHHPVNRAADNRALVYNGALVGSEVRSAWADNARQTPAHRRAGARNFDRTLV